MASPDTTADFADRLSTIRSLVACAFMACDAIDDSDQCDALQTVLARAETLIREAESDVAVPLWIRAAA